LGRGSKTKYTFANLTPGQKYWVPIAIVGKGSEIAFSDPYLSKYVQQSSLMIKDLLCRYRVVI
jgi:hypothetical protein